MRGTHGLDGRVGMLLAVVACVLVAAVLSAVRWELHSLHAFGDTFWYARLAGQLGGAGTTDATLAAARLMAEHQGLSDPSAWVTAANTIDPRYPAIFGSRPVYPAVAALLDTVLQLPTAMAVAAVGAGVAFGAAFGWFLLWRIGTPLAVAAGLWLGFALPSGRWFAAMIADGWMIAWWTVTLGLATAYLVRGRRIHLLLALMALALLYVTKAANGATLVVALVVVGAAMLQTRAAAARRAALLAGCAVAVAAGQLLLFAVLGLPGMAESLQDLFTSHFREPDVDDLLGRLVDRNALILPGLFDELIFRSGALFVAVPLLLPLLLIRRWWAGLWLVAGLASFLTVVLHPVTTEVPRLMAPIWISAALGGALAVAWALERVAPALRARLS